MKSTTWARFREHYVASDSHQHAEVCASGAGVDGGRGGEEACDRVVCRRGDCPFVTEFGIQHVQSCISTPHPPITSSASRAFSVPVQTSPVRAKYRVRLAHCKNISALPAADWSIVRISVRQVAEGARCVQLVTFPFGGEKAEDDAAAYNGELETKPLQAFVTEALPNYVVTVESADEVQKFLQVGLDTVIKPLFLSRFAAGESDSSPEYIC
eukprot:1176904-Prorocentrum_minimum.AAC.2